MRGPRALTVFAVAFDASSPTTLSELTITENRRTIKIKAVEIRIEAFMELIFPATVASDLASHSRTALASSSAA